MKFSLSMIALAAILAPACKSSSSSSSSGHDATPTALEVLARADAAHKALKGVSYTIHFEATSAASAAPKVDADVQLKGWGTMNLPRRFLIDATVMLGAPARLTIGSDGAQFYVIDHARKRVHADADPRVFGTARDILRAVTMAELVHPEPYGDELSSAATQTLEPVAQVAGEACDQVVVKYAGGQRSSRWFFSKTTSLVRAVHRSQTAAGGDEVARQTLTRLVAAEPPDSAFALVVPAGYTTTKDPAS